MHHIEMGIQLLTKKITGKVLKISMSEMGNSKESAETSRLKNKVIHDQPLSIIHMKLCRTCLWSHDHILVIYNAFVTDIKINKT